MTSALSIRTGARSTNSSFKLPSDVTVALRKDPVDSFIKVDVEGGGGVAAVIESITTGSTGLAASDMMVALIEAAAVAISVFFFATASFFCSAAS